MTVSDQIADFLTRIRNAVMAKHRFVDVNLSKMNLQMAQILRDQGYVHKFLSREKEGKRNGAVRIFLKYSDGAEPIIQGLKRISKPSVRKYVGCENVPVVVGGMGVAVMSTPQGVMTGKKAKELNIGGEVLFYVW